MIHARLHTTTALVYRYRALSNTGIGPVHAASHRCEATDALPGEARTTPGLVRSAISQLPVGDLNREADLELPHDEETLEVSAPGDRPCSRRTRERLSEDQY